MVNIRKPKNALKFKKPSGWWGSSWREALPAGNGTIGAAVYGGAGADTILITHSDLWWQGRVGVLPDIADKIKDVKKLSADFRFREAQDVLSSALIQKGFRPQSAFPLPLCDFKVSQPFDRPVKDYMRVLNMENGEVSVTFKDGATKYERSLFVSRAQDCVCYELTRSGSKSIDVSFSLDLHDRFNARTATSISALPEGVATKYENFFMYFAARGDNGQDFGAVAKIAHYGGSMEVTMQGITVRGAERIFVIIKPFVATLREKAWKDIKAALTANKLPYDKMLKEHTTRHSRLFNAVDLDLDADGRDLFVEDLLDRAVCGGELTNALTEKLWAYGRYLLISGTDPLSRPLAPYGLWCGEYRAENSHYDSAGGVQAAYSQAFAGGLTEYLDPLFHMYESVSDDLKKNAARLFGARGFFVPSVMALGTGAPGTIEPWNLHFTGAAGWICQLMFDYYLFTDDKKFLKERALPFMKETALFFEEFFKVDDRGLYEICPSYSPYNSPLGVDKNPEKLLIAKNGTVEFAIAAELLKNLLAGVEVTGLYKNEAAKWSDMLTRIPPVALNEDGTLREYLDPRLADNFTGTFAAHLYPLLSFRQAEYGEDYKKAAALTVKRRLSGAVGAHTAGSLAQFAAYFTALGDGEAALDIINTIIRSFAMNNLVTAANDWRGMGVGTNNKWAPFSLEANMRMTSVMQDMLVQSAPGVIRLLPAVPDDWTKGSVSGIKTRGACEVELEWDKKRGTIGFRIKALRACAVTLLIPAGIKRIKGPGAERYNPETGVLPLSLPAGKALSFDMK